MVDPPIFFGFWASIFSLLFPFLCSWVFMCPFLCFVAISDVVPPKNPKPPSLAGCPLVADIVHVTMVLQV